MKKMATTHESEARLPVDFSALSPKGFPWRVHQGADPADGSWNILDGSCFMPVMTLRSSVLHSNIEAMAEYCRREGVLLAPHGKTTMSPEMFRLQLEAGAWAITAATAWQAASIYDMGCRRVLLANVLVETSGIRWAVEAQRADPAFELYCYVDSVASVDRMERELERLGSDRPIRVLVELGHSPGRTGARTLREALAIADRTSRSRVLSLCGVAGFEGLIPGASVDDLSPIDRFLQDLRNLAEQIDRSIGFDRSEEVILTAGGSAYFDRVVEILRDTGLSVPSRIVLRSGGYVSHDSAMYETTSPLAGRRPPNEALQLLPALELWSTVWWRPEPTLAILGFGKRDTSYDYGLPIPLRVHRQGGEAQRPLHAGAEIFELNDQHAFLRLSESDPLRPGDVVVCGISHPCTAFERWKQIPLIDERFQVSGLVNTYF